MSIREQRLAHDFDELTAGYWRDTTLAEAVEVEDAAFRHWDTLTFASQPPLRPWEGPVDANGVAAAPPGSSDPANSPGPFRQSTPCTTDVTGGQACSESVPPGGAGLPNPSVQHWMWTT